ncbi:mitochondrial carrier domain-containing protein [Hyaloraphidium curvatum]|nr:mitochondrial carrier domain-containing protein [Hyaloraphidium curvatum]
MSREVAQSIVAAMAASFAAAPLDRAKLVTQSGQFPGEHALKVLRHLFDAQGFAGLWRGAWASSLRAIPVIAVGYVFGLRAVPKEGSEEPPSRARAVLRSLAQSLTALLLATPLDVLRARLATDLTAGLSFSDSLSRAAPKDLAGWFSGFPAAAAGILAYTAAFHGLVVAAELAGVRGPGGAIAATLASGLAQFPFDVVRTRMMSAASPTPAWSAFSKAWDRGTLFLGFPASLLHGAAMAIAAAGVHAAMRSAK